MNALLNEPSEKAVYFLAHALRVKNSTHISDARWLADCRKTTLQCRALGMSLNPYHPQWGFLGWSRTIALDGLDTTREQRLANIEKFWGKKGEVQ